MRAGRKRRGELTAIVERCTVVRGAENAGAAGQLPHPPGHYDEVRVGRLRIAVDSECGARVAPRLEQLVVAVGGASGADALRIGREVFPEDPEMQARLAALGWCCCSWPAPPSLRVAVRHRRSEALLQPAKSM